MMDLYIGDTVIDSEIYIKQLKLAKTQCFQELLADHRTLIQPIGKVTEQVLDPFEVTCLKQMYQNIFSAEYQLSDVSCIINRFERIKYCNKLISSKKAKSE